MKYNLRVPKDLNDLTVEQYLRYILIDEPTTEDLLTIFLEIDRETLRSFTAESVDNLQKHLTEVLNQEPKFQPTFKLEGKTYGFEPNLDDITFGVNEDATAYLGDKEKLNKAMAVLYRPITERVKSKYRIELYKGSGERSVLFLKAPLGVALGMTVFFYNLTKDLLRATLNYTLEEMTQEVQELESKKDLSKSGVLTKSSTHLLREILEGLKKWESLTFTLA